MLRLETFPGGAIEWTSNLRSFLMSPKDCGFFEMEKNYLIIPIIHNIKIINNGTVYWVDGRENALCPSVDMLPIMSEPWSAVKAAWYLHVWHWHLIVRCDKSATEGVTSSCFLLKVIFGSSDVTFSGREIACFSETTIFGHWMENEDIWIAAKNVSPVGTCSNLMYIRDCSHVPKVSTTGWLLW